MINNNNSNNNNNNNNKNNNNTARQRNIRTKLVIFRGFLNVKYKSDF